MMEPSDIETVSEWLPQQPMEIVDVTRAVPTKLAEEITGATLRQLDTWATNWIDLHTPASGSGSSRRWSLDNVIIAARLVSLGLALGPGQSIEARVALATTGTVVTDDGAVIRVDFAEVDQATRDRWAATADEIEQSEP